MRGGLLLLGRGLAGAGERDGCRRGLRRRCSPAVLLAQQLRQREVGAAALEFPDLGLKVEDVAQGRLGGLARDSQEFVAGFEIGGEVDGQPE